MSLPTRQIWLRGVEQPAGGFGFPKRPNKRFPGCIAQPCFGDAGWSSPVARQAHNLKVVGSNPTPATNRHHIFACLLASFSRTGLFLCHRAPDSPPNWLGAPKPHLCSVPTLPSAPCASQSHLYNQFHAAIRVGNLGLKLESEYGTEDAADLLPVLPCELRYVGRCRERQGESRSR